MSNRPKAALIRLATGIAGLIAWGIILFNGLERACSQMIDRVCVEYGGRSATPRRASGLPC